MLLIVCTIRDSGVLPHVTSRMVRSHLCGISDPMDLSGFQQLKLCRMKINHRQALYASTSLCGLFF